jgi:hypothetical protein
MESLSRQHDIIESQGVKLKSLYAEVDEWKRIRGEVENIKGMYSKNKEEIELLKKDSTHMVSSHHFNEVMLTKANKSELMNTQDMIKSSLLSPIILEMNQMQSKMDEMKESIAKMKKVQKTLAGDVQSHEKQILSLASSDSNHPNVGIAHSSADPFKSSLHHSKHGGGGGSTSLERDHTYLLNELDNSGGVDSTFEVTKLKGLIRRVIHVLSEKVTREDVKGMMIEDMKRLNESIEGGLKKKVTKGRVWESVEPLVISLMEKGLSKYFTTHIPPLKESLSGIIQEQAQLSKQQVNHAIYQVTVKIGELQEAQRSITQAVDHWSSTFDIKVFDILRRV